MFSWSAEHVYTCDETAVGTLATTCSATDPTNAGIVFFLRRALAVLSTEPGREIGGGSGGGLTGTTAAAACGDS